MKTFGQKIHLERLGTDNVQIFHTGRLWTSSKTPPLFPGESEPSQNLMLSCRRISTLCRTAWPWSSERSRPNSIQCDCHDRVLRKNDKVWGMLWCDCFVTLFPLWIVYTKGKSAEQALAPIVSDVSAAMSVDTMHCALQNSNQQIRGHARYKD